MAMVVVGHLWFYWRWEATNCLDDGDEAGEPFRPNVCGSADRAGSWSGKRRVELGNSGISREQTLSILARAKKETVLAKRDRLVNVGVKITPNGFVEGKLQLENLKQMLISIRDEVARWLGLIDFLPIEGWGYVYCRPKTRSRKQWSGFVGRGSE